MIFEGGQFFGALAAVGDGVLSADAGLAAVVFDVPGAAVPVAEELLQFAEITFFLRRGFTGAGFLAEEGCCGDAVGFEDVCELNCD